MILNIDADHLDFFKDIDDIRHSFRKFAQLLPADGALIINADTAAGAVAGALHADYFVLISDVPGVLDADKKLIPSLDRARIAELIEAGVINGGMIPKVQSCLHALDEGCSRALILDGRQPSSLRRYLLDGEPLGTVVTA